eukprot:386722_1
MADITLISGSTLGGAEYVAEHLAEKLEEAGFTTETLHGPLLEDLPASGIWLVISSTHGAGDIPDNLSPFYEALKCQTNSFCGPGYFHHFSQYRAKADNRCEEPQRSANSTFNSIYHIQWPHAHHRSHEEAGQQQRQKRVEFELHDGQYN